MLLQLLVGPLALFLVGPLSIHAQTPPPLTPSEYKDLEKLVVKLFEAYNKDDVKGVFADYFSPVIKGQDVGRLYKALFEPSKDKYGKFKTHQFDSAMRVKNLGIAQLVLNTEFEKKKAMVTVIFGMEEGKWKIKKVTIADE